MKRSDSKPDGDDTMPSLVELLRTLLEDAQTLVEAETSYWRSALGFALARIKTIALLLVLALFFLFFTLMALVVGLLLALGSLIGPWPAVGVMTVTLALATAWCLRQGLRKAKRMVHLLTGTTP